MEPGSYLDLAVNTPLAFEFHRFAAINHNYAMRKVPNIANRT